MPVGKVSQTDVENGCYGHPDFDLWTLTVAQIRYGLQEYGVAFSDSDRKPKLVEYLRDARKTEVMRPISKSGEARRKAEAPGLGIIPALKDLIKESFNSGSLLSLSDEFVRQFPEHKPLIKPIGYACAKMRRKRLHRVISGEEQKEQADAWNAFNIMIYKLHEAEITPADVLSPESCYYDVPGDTTYAFEPTESVLINGKQLEMEDEYQKLTLTSHKLFEGIRATSKSTPVSTNQPAAPLSKAQPASTQVIHRAGRTGIVVRIDGIFLLIPKTPKDTSEPDVSLWNQLMKIQTRPNRLKTQMFDQKSDSSNGTARRRGKATSDLQLEYSESKAQKINCSEMFKDVRKIMGSNLSAGKREGFRITGMAARLKWNEDTQNFEMQESPIYISIKGIGQIDILMENNGLLRGRSDDWAAHSAISLFCGSRFDRDTKTQFDKKFSNALQTYTEGIGKRLKNDSFVDNLKRLYYIDSNVERRLS